MVTTMVTTMVTIPTSMLTTKLIESEVMGRMLLTCRCNACETQSRNSHVLR